MRSRRTVPKQIPGLFLLIITMTAIAVFIQIDRMKNKSADLRARAYRQTEKGVRIEAEEMVLSGAMVDPSGTFVRFPAVVSEADTAASPTPTPKLQCPPAGVTAGGTATVDVDLNVSTNYKMWVQMSGSGDSANSVWLQLDNLYCVNVGDLAGMPKDTWEWVDYQAGSTASKIPAPIIGTGHHTVKLIGNASEPGVSVDRILMMIDASCVPTGNGDECIGIVSTPTPTPPPPTPTQPPPTATPAPTSDAISKKNPVQSPKIMTPTLPAATLGQPYSASVVATDDTIADNLTMTVTNLPAGLTVSSCEQTSGLGGTTLTCPITGIPTVRGANFPVFTVTDALGNKSSKRIKLQVE